MLQALISHLTRSICSISRLLISPRFAPHTSSAASPQTALAPIHLNLARLTSPPNPHRLKLLYATTLKPKPSRPQHLHTATPTRPLKPTSNLALQSDFFTFLCSLKPSSVIIINHLSLALPLTPSPTLCTSLKPLSEPQPKPNHLPPPPPKYSKNHMKTRHLSRLRDEV